MKQNGFTLIDFLFLMILLVAVTTLSAVGWNHYKAEGATSAQSHIIK